MPRIPLVEDLTDGPLPAGSSILVEYDPSSLWYNASITIAAGWLRTGGKVGYNVAVQPPDEVRSQLRRLALKVEELEKEDKLSIVDHYTIALGQKSKERFAVLSMKVADQSIQFMKSEGQAALSHEVWPQFLGIRDDLSIFDRFNQERNWVEFLLTRYIPMIRSLKATAIRGLIRGIHSDWVYKQLEAANDGIIDFKLEETSDTAGKEARSIMRIRSMKNVRFDARWYRLKTGKSFEVMLDR